MAKACKKGIETVVQVHTDKRNTLILQYIMTKYLKITKTELREMRTEGNVRNNASVRS